MVLRGKVDLACNEDHTEYQRLIDADNSRLSVRNLLCHVVIRAPFTIRETEMPTSLQRRIFFDINLCCFLVIAFCYRRVVGHIEENDDLRHNLARNRALNAHAGAPSRARRTRLPREREDTAVATIVDTAS